MFDLGWSEFLLVGLVALVVIGPRELPVALRTLGNIVGRVRFLVEEFRSGINDFVQQSEDGMPSINPKNSPPLPAENLDQNKLSSKDVSKGEVTSESLKGAKKFERDANSAPLKHENEASSVTSGGGKVPTE
jgi:sec-independent protein translocase protein TatB